MATLDARRHDPAPLGPARLAPVAAQAAPARMAAVVVPAAGSVEAHRVAADGAAPRPRRLRVLSAKRFARPAR